MKKSAIPQQNVDVILPSSKTKPIMTYILIISLVFVSGWKIDFSISELIDGLPNMWELLVQFVPPDWAYFSEITSPMLDTIRMAIIGTTFGGLLALPLSMFSRSKYFFINMGY